MSVELPRDDRARKQEGKRCTVKVCIVYVFDYLLYLIYAPNRPV